MSATTHLAAHARGYGMNAESLTEKEPEKLHARVRDIVMHVRESREPFFLEILQRRFVPHSIWHGELPLDGPLIPEAQDPVATLRVFLEKTGTSRQTLTTLHDVADRNIEDALRRAAKDRELSSEEFLSFYHA
jgi:TPP-dependent pyruvate/acetoin dehydrogenase alpha subunit